MIRSSVQAARDRDWGRQSSVALSLRVFGGCCSLAFGSPSTQTRGTRKAKIDNTQLQNLQHLKVS